MDSESNRKYQAFIKKLQQETVYFKNPFEKAVIKSIPGQGYQVKFKGKEPFEAQKGSEVVTDGILQYSEISEQEYNDF